MGLNKKAIFLHYDNQSVVHLVKNLVFRSRTKQINIRNHFNRELISECMLNLKKILGAKNPSDMFIKVALKDKLRLYMALNVLLRN